MKSIVILSGGLDSTVLLYYLKNQGRDLRALSIDYGQRHKRELQAASKIAALAGIEHKILDLSSVRQILGGSSQTDDNVEVPNGHYEEESMKKTVVPMRNSILLCLASAYAVAEKADTVAFGAHSGDHAIYPDCRAIFTQRFSAMLEVADWAPPKLEAPFVTISKSEIVSLGASLGVPFVETYSCYKGREVHCGVCGTDTERKEAFKLANIPDPTVYLDTLEVH